MLLIFVRQYKISKYITLFIQISSSRSITQPALSSSHVLVVDPSEQSLMKNGKAINSNKEEERPDQLGSEKVSIWSAIFRTYGSSYAITGLFKLFYDLIGFLHPIILK